MGAPKGLSSAITAEAIGRAANSIGRRPAARDGNTSLPSFTISTGWCLTALSLTLVIRSPTSVTAIWLATRTSAARPTSSAKYGSCGFDQAVQAYFQVTDRHRALPRPDWVERASVFLHNLIVLNVALWSALFTWRDTHAMATHPSC